jgi:dTDP-4-dehydrorhamnose 3,5-epimerase
MKIMGTKIDGVVAVENNPFEDDRGTFTRLFCAGELANHIGSRHIAQINRSRTSAVGAVRGLHYQRSPHAEMKLVLCLKGRVWDVAVDLRAGSRTFLHWHAEELSPGNSRMLIIPEGCAHGFQVLDADSELLYLHTASYNPASEGGVQPSDPLLRISWPLRIVDPSERDRTHPLLSRDFAGLTL